jgi:hypothetical protein
MPSESFGGNGSEGTSGASTGARNGNPLGGSYSQAQDSQAANVDNPYATYTTGENAATVPISEAELPDQSPGQQEAAANVLKWLGYAPSIAGMVNPAFGAAMGVGQSLVKFANSDQSLGDAAMGFAKDSLLSAALAKLGPMAQIGQGLVNGDLGQGVGNTVNGLVNAALAGYLHVPAGLVGIGTKALGSGDAVGSIANAVNGVAGPANDAARSLFGRDTKPVGALTRTASAAPSSGGSYHDPVYG